MSTVTKALKRAIKSQSKAVRLALLRKRYGFSSTDLREGLSKLGIQAGDAVLAHSSHDQFAAFQGKATDINAALQEVVGKEGHVLMPTLPFSGTAIDYVSSGRVFDVRRTPSQMGLLTELFRRQFGVQRSVHPTHSVAVGGPRSGSFIHEHHMAETPCGKGTPFSKLADENGKLLFMGTDIGVMTYYHFVEEVLEPELPFSPFTTEVFSARSLDANGNELVTKTRLFNPVYSRKRNLHVLARHLKEAQLWHERRVGNVKLILLGARDVLTTCRSMAKKGIYCYDA